MKKVTVRWKSDAMNNEWVMSNDMAESLESELINERAWISFKDQTGEIIVTPTADIDLVRIQEAE